MSEYSIQTKKGQIPSQEEFEAQLVARHTPGVHAKVKNAVVGHSRSWRPRL